MPVNDVFRLFANCLPVKGARRSLICDVQKQRARFIPNDLFFILTERADRPVSAIKNDYSEEDGHTIDDYFNMLVREDFGFWCDEPERFPALNLLWDRPEKITNAIIDVDNTSAHDYRRIFLQLDELGCQAAQVRTWAPIPLSGITAILAAISGLRFRHLDLTLAFHPEYSEAALVELCLHNQVINRIVVHTSPFESRKIIEPLPVSVCFVREKAEPATCGQVSPSYFSLNLEHFTEAQHYNTCLNRKISVTSDGEIKGCPAMAHSCGNIRNTSLGTAIADPALIQIASITKDQVTVCRDCEFRYICTDCRAFIRDVTNPYSKPAKCSYDPYTATWDTEEHFQAARETCENTYV